MNTISIYRSYYTVDDNTFSQIIALADQNNNEFEEIIEDTLIDTTSVNDRIVFPIPNVINKIDKDVSNEMNCCIVKSTAMSITIKDLPITSDQCTLQPHEPSNDNGNVQSNPLFDKSRNKNNNKTTSPNKSIGQCQLSTDIILETIYKQKTINEKMLDNGNIWKMM